MYRMKHKIRWKFLKRNDLLTISKTFWNRLRNEIQTVGSQKAALNDCRISSKCKKFRRFGPSFGNVSLYKSSAGVVRLTNRRSKASDVSFSSVCAVSIGIKSVCSTLPWPMCRRYSCVSPSRRKTQIKCWRYKGNFENALKCENQNYKIWRNSIRTFKPCKAFGSGTYVLPS